MSVGDLIAFGVHPCATDLVKAQTHFGIRLAVGPIARAAYGFWTCAYGGLGHDDIMKPLSKKGAKVRQMGTTILYTLFIFSTYFKIFF